MGKPATKLLSIGAAAKALGVSTHTLRYYEKIGLLKAPMNSQGRREYTEELLNKIQFIKRAKRMQFSLSEIALLLELDQSEKTPKPEVRTMVEDKLSDIDLRLAELVQLKQNLNDLLNACQSSRDNEQCPILEEMKNEH